MWQGLYEELQDRDFMVISVAEDSRGAEVVRPFVEMFSPGFPVLVDEEHVVSELYGMVNVPTAVWIDEDGRIVRPPETAGTSDAFREMGATGGLSPEALEDLQDTRRRYTDAIRDWVAHGTASRFALSPDEVRRRLRPRDDDDARAGVLFRLGQHLMRTGRDDEGNRLLQEAKSLRPHSWNFKRQTWNLEEAGDARSGGPEFWAAVAALGEDFYYQPVEDI